MAAPPPLPERLVSQLLAGRAARDPVAVVERLLAVQAQDARGARLAVRARTRGLGASAVDAALDEGALVVSWLNRGTLHLVRREDYPWLHALTTPQLATGNARRLRQEGVSEAAAERGVATIERALAEEGPLGRAALRDRLAAARVPTAGQALVHVLFLATLRGLVVRGPTAGDDHLFVLVRDHLGDLPDVDPDAALGELARRYLGGHGPADAGDLARWAGIPLGAARRGLRAIAPELARRPDGLAHLRRAARPRLPPPRLLGPFDPLLLGWAGRDDVVGRHRGLVTTNGIFRPFALVGGRAVGTWRLEAGAVRLELLERIAQPDVDALAADAADVERFLAT
jgi:hypothetical protein